MKRNSMKNFVIKIWNGVIHFQANFHHLIVRNNKTINEHLSLSLPQIDNLYRRLGGFTLSIRFRFGIQHYVALSKFREIVGTESFQVMTETSFRNKASRRSNSVSWKIYYR